MQPTEKMKHLKNDKERTQGEEKEEDKNDHKLQHERNNKLHNRSK